MIVGWQRAKNGNAGLWALAFALTSIPATVGAPDDSSATSCIKTSGTDFTVDGRPFFVTGAKNHDRTFGAQDEVTRVVDDAMAIVANVVRTFPEPKIRSLDRSVAAILPGRRSSVAPSVVAGPSLRSRAVPGWALHESLSREHARRST